jgi:hypothetical protein
MKKMRSLFLVLVLGLGLCCPRAQGQTTAMTMTFSIICQYVTNSYTTNLSPLVINKFQRVTTVLLNSANLVKAMSVDMFGTKWTNWAGASIVYEQNMTNGNQGIFLRLAGRQTNVSSFFVNDFSTNGFVNMFSQDVDSAFHGTNYDIMGTNSQLPLVGGNVYEHETSTNSNFNVSDNLAYLTFTSVNTSFTLFGFSQGTLLNTVYDREGDIAKVNKAMITGAGTFTLNVTTNFLDIAVTNATQTPAIHYVGLAHGTVYMAIPYHLNIGSAEGGP